MEILSKKFILVFGVFLFVSLFCSIEVEGSCWRYGHSCWGGHGKRSGQTQERISSPRSQKIYEFGPLLNQLLQKRIPSSQTHSKPDELYEVADEEDIINNSYDEPEEGMMMLLDEEGEERRLPLSSNAEPKENLLKEEEEEERNMVYGIHGKLVKDRSGGPAVVKNQMESIVYLLEER